VPTILGTQRRFAPGLRYLKDLLGDGYVGRVRSGQDAGDGEQFRQKIAAGASLERPSPKISWALPQFSART